MQKLMPFRPSFVLVAIVLACLFTGLPSVNAVPAQTVWSLFGNSGTNPAVSFLGTTDAQDLALRTNNVQRLRVSSDGIVLVGPGPRGGHSEIVEVSGAGNVTAGDHELIAAWSLVGVPNQPAYAGLSIGYRADGTGARGGIVRSLNALPMMLGTTNGPMSVVIRDPTGADAANSGKGNVGIGVGPTPASRLHVSTDSLTPNETGIIVEIPGLGPRRIIVGDADSAGVGFRALKVAN